MPETMPCTRQELITAGLPVVRRIALRTMRRLPRSVGVDDLFGAGAEGLLRAADSYDPERSTDFRHYASVFIRGAIGDELRARDNLTSHGRMWRRAVARAVDELQQSLGRSPAEHEVASRLGMSLERYQLLIGNLKCAPSASSSNTSPEECPSCELDPEATLLDSELRCRLRTAVASLPARTQAILELYYQEGRTQLAIGHLFGVTEARVCQILAASMAQLRDALDDGRVQARRT